MKRATLSLIIFSSILWSCSGSEEETSDSNEEGMNDEMIEEVDESAPYVREDGAEVYPMSDGKEMIIQRIEGGECSGYSFNDVVEESTVIDEDTLVKRRGDSLIFTSYANTAGDTKELVFVDTYEEGSMDDGDYNYIYQGILKQFDSWVVFVKGFEHDKTILIDKFSHKQTEFIGMPVASPDKRFVLVGNADQDVGFTENHLSVYKWDWDSNGMELLVKAELDLKGWAPYEIVWEDDYHFTIKQGRFNEETYGIDYSCAEVIIE
jgi:hypothetical protein